jgi:hypothetical protein
MGAAGGLSLRRKGTGTTTELSGEAEAVSFFFGLNIERRANETGCDLPGCDFDNAIEVHFGELGSFMPNGVQTHAEFEKVLDERLAFDGIVGEVLVMGRR